VDIAPSMIEHAKSYNRYPERIHYVLNESPHLQVFQDESFDLVYSDITLLHIEPRYSLEYVREFLRVVRSSGAVVFQLPSPTRRQKMRDRIPRTLVKVGNEILTIRRPKMEVYGVEPDVVRQTVRDAGGEVLEQSTADGTTFRAEDNRYVITKR
jgi:ubiquinone/menaquinone biosynthesis C-methylase UbiE